MTPQTLSDPLAEISKQARPYPAHLLPDAGTGLLLFAAAFLGHNDAIHYARKRMACTCVDTDADRVEQMAGLYPAFWDFLVDDAWQFADQAFDNGDRWDAVSVDPFTGDAGDRALDTLEAWCALADQLVTVTVKRSQTPTTPSGWQASRFPRSSEVDWLVLRRT